MIYMLNLVFDPGDDTETDEGRFMEYDHKQPSVLQQSEVWLQQADSANPNPDPDTEKDWIFLQKDGAHPILLSLDDQAWIRILGLNSTGFAARMTTIVARNPTAASQTPMGKPYQTRGSPFPLTGTQSRGVYEDPTYESPSAGGSWVQQLGAVTFRTTPPYPKPPGFHDAYSVTVALTAGQGERGDKAPAALRTYSHDPDMDVDC